MTELDNYRPPDYNNPTGPFSRWAFRTYPQFERNGDGSWTAWYPGRDWSVSAPSKTEAINRLRDESIARTDRYATDEAVCARHLQTPIPGIYAMDVGLANELAETESQEDLQRAFVEAEAARVAGRCYTKADYQRSSSG
jgi:hypothetical protein